MALTDSQKSDLSFKKVMTAKANTSTANAYFEEGISSRKAVLITDIWKRSAEIPAVAAPLTDVVEKITDHVLTYIPNTSSFYSTVHSDIIPFNFSTNNTYAYVLKTSTGVTIPLGYKDWYLDPEACVLTFFGGLSNSGSIIFNAANPPKITCYKYIGGKGVPSGGPGPDPVNERTQTLTVTTANQTAFTLTSKPLVVISFTVNGAPQATSDYSIATTTGGTPVTTLTWNNDFKLDPDDVVQIRYTY